jgi:hypothetical protein
MAVVRSWLLLLPLLTACPRESPPAPQDMTAPPDLPSQVEVNTPEAEVALGKGFYAVEDGRWRWTGPSFEVSLAAPRPALHLRFLLPQAAMTQLKQVTLSATVNGAALEPQRYDRAGEFEYVRPLPPSLAGQALRVSFTVDKPFEPGGSDTRKLGVIVYSIAIK